MSGWALIVATIGRTDPVAALLRSLAGVPQRPRVLLMDQNPDERLASVVAAWVGRLRLEHVRIPPRGVSQARNAGLALLRNEAFVAFPDDDCCYQDDTLIEAERAFACAPQIDALIADWYGIGEVPPPKRTSAALRRVDRIGALRQSPTYVLFFRRQAVDRAGRFDETLGPGRDTPWLCGEDVDFLLRAGGLDGRAAVAPAVRVSHPRVSEGWSRDKAFGYGRGRMRVLSKHGYPLWFSLASIVHPLVAGLMAPAPLRRFRWHLFRGRLHEWLHPHRAAP